MSALICDFCKKPSAEVRWLVASNSGVHICDTCALQALQVVVTAFEEKVATIPLGEGISGSIYAPSRVDYFVAAALSSTPQYWLPEQAAERAIAIGVITDNEMRKREEKAGGAA